MRPWKWIVVVAIIFISWKYVVPWMRQEPGGPDIGTSAAPAPANSCVRSAEQASEVWGSGLRQFINPPYDLEAWERFREDVEARISSAESGCGCAAESCVKSADAMKELRRLISDLDSAIRSASPPPSDIVQRQESIDSQLSNAADLVREGK